MSGITLNSVVEHIEYIGAYDVFSAALINKKHDRKSNPLFKVDFIGLDAPDAFLFGCGMDYKDFYRNLPCVYSIDPVLLH